MQLERNRITIDDDAVVKHHVGPDAVRRAKHAAAALRHATEHGLPVPRLLRLDGATLEMAPVTGVRCAATLFDEQPAMVLATIGRFARQLHAVTPPPVLVGDDGAWLHGDLCPVNVLVTEDGRLASILDWEETHVGDPLEDLVWTEWLARTHHPAAVPVLGELYAAYAGPTADDERRRRAMRTCLSRQRRRALTRQETEEWEAHLAALDGLDLRL